MQYQLLQLALEEENVNNFYIDVDHQKGINYINSKKFGIIYPRSFIQKCNTLDDNKIYEYVFKGGLKSSKSDINREYLFKKYFNNKDSKIVGTKDGICRKDKTVFDFDYYQLIANGRFSLCPNWSGDWWNHEEAWTYRFIESCFAKSIPVLFKETPLGKDFIKDIFFVWADELHHVKDYDSIVEDNYQKAIKYWTLQLEEINQLRLYNES